MAFGGLKSLVEAYMLAMDEGSKHLNRLNGLRTTFNVTVCGGVFYE